MAMIDGTLIQFDYFTVAYKWHSQDHFLHVDLTKSSRLLYFDLTPKIGNPFSKIHPANKLPTIGHQKLAAPSSVMRAWLCGLRGAQTISLSPPQIAQQPPPTLSSDYSSPVSSNVLHVEIMHTTGRTSCLFICFKLFCFWGFKCYSFESLHNWVHALQVGTGPQSQIRFD